MSYIQVEGGRRLSGSLIVQGAKNAVLPILSAALLHRGTTVLTQVPDISDVRDTLELLTVLGCHVTRDGHRVVIDAENVVETPLPKDLVGRMRSSFLLSGAMLGRAGGITTCYPGGCTIGARPIDLHLKGFEKMGALCMTDTEQLFLRAEHLRGAEIRLPFPSVGATENLILAGVLADGETVIIGAAKEPEIGALVRCLIGMGADIVVRDDRIVVAGGAVLHDSEFAIPGDRIVAGTILAALGSCGGEVWLRQIDPEDMGISLEFLAGAGMEIRRESSGIRASCEGRLPRGMRLATGPYPEFPTDLQAVFMAMLACAGGESTIQENVFESRFRHVEQLRRLGASIRVEGNRAFIRGGSRLSGNLAEALDLRAGAALVVAGLAAEGFTMISQAEYISRGYEDLPGDLRSLGANVWTLP